MAVTKQKKAEVLAELIKNFEGAKSVVFSQYQGTNVKNMRELRKRLFAQDISFQVARKTLMKLAAKKIGLAEIPDGFMEGPIGLAFSRKDEIAPAKIIHEFNKVAETVKITGALFEGKFIDAEAAKTIAVLPSREVLLARLVGSMKSPIYGFYSVLHGILRNFVYALSEIQKKKPTPAA
ncbi:MAG: 50S ribosomal protein L10 [Patescibacteria group bacterium]